MKTEHEKEQRRQQKRRARERKRLAKPLRVRKEKSTDGNRLVRGELWATVSEPPMLTAPERARERAKTWRYNHREYFVTKEKERVERNLKAGLTGCGKPRRPRKPTQTKAERARAKGATNMAAGLTYAGKQRKPRPPPAPEWRTEAQIKLDLYWKKRAWLDTPRGKALANAQKARRRARKAEAIPSWGKRSPTENKAIAALYAEAAAVGGHVDHCIPIAGCRVCGAKGDHASWNLKVLTVAQNVAKGDRCTDCWKLSSGQTTQINGRAPVPPC